MYKPTEELTDELVIANLDLLQKLSAIKATKFLENLGVYEILNRPRSPEEIFHMLNFTTLNEEFFRIFDLLSEYDLLSKQGEFYADNPRREFLVSDLEEEIKAKEDDLLSPFAAQFDRLTPKYESILKGEQGKLSENELIRTLDSFYGSEFFFQLRELFYKRISSRSPLFFTKDRISIVNWGVGSGYDSLHLANFFGEKINILSIEPISSIYRCLVIQDLYEIYNVDFMDLEQLNHAIAKESIDIFMGTKFVFKDDMKEYIKTIQNSLHKEGYLALTLTPSLNMGLDWIMSVYEPYEYNLILDEHFAILKHYGLSKTKFIGLNNHFLLIQKT
ncbi:MAG: hypothetical protein V3V41_07145 [Candidatus Heimdallarchaeota archaeon]